MDPAAEHRASHDVEEFLGLDTALPQKGKNFSEHLQGGGGHCVSRELDQICAFRVIADDEGPLTEKVEDGTDALDLVGFPGRDDVKLARLRGVWISEYRRRHIILAVPRMLIRDC